MTNKLIDILMIFDQVKGVDENIKKDISTHIRDLVFASLSKDKLLELLDTDQVRNAIIRIIPEFKQDYQNKVRKLLVTDEEIQLTKRTQLEKAISTLESLLPKFNSYFEELTKDTDWYTPDKFGSGIQIKKETISILQEKVDQIYKQIYNVPDSKIPWNTRKGALDFLTKLDVDFNKILKKIKTLLSDCNKQLGIIKYRQNNLSKSKTEYYKTEYDKLLQIKDDIEYDMSRLEDINKELILLRKDFGNESWKQTDKYKYLLEELRIIIKKYENDLPEGKKDFYFWTDLQPTVDFRSVLNPALFRIQKALVDLDKYYGQDANMRFERKQAKKKKKQSQGEYIALKQQPEQQQSPKIILEQQRVPEITLGPEQKPEISSEQKQKMYKEYTDTLNECETDFRRILNKLQPQPIKVKYETQKKFSDIQKEFYQVKDTLIDVLNSKESYDLFDLFNSTKSLYEQVMNLEYIVGREDEIGMYMENILNFVKASPSFIDLFDLEIKVRFVLKKYRSLTSQQQENISHIYTKFNDFVISKHIGITHIRLVDQLILLMILIGMFVLSILIRVSYTTCPLGLGILASIAIGFNVIIIPTLLSDVVKSRDFISVEYLKAPSIVYMLLLCTLTLSYLSNDLNYRAYRFAQVFMGLIIVCSVIWFLKIRYIINECTKSKPTTKPTTGSR